MAGSAFPALSGANGGREYPAERRAALVEALRRQNGAGHPGLEILAKPNAVAVVTGQQVGLFSGPAYSVYKALTAVKLARLLIEGGTPAVPVFWLATEDHDFEKSAKVHLFDAAHQRVTWRQLLRRMRGQPSGAAGGRFVPGSRVARGPVGFPFGDDVAATIEAAYQPGRTMGQAFRLLLEEWLGRFGLLFVDPLAPEIRALGAPCSAGDGAEAELSTALLERNKDLESSGYHAQVHIEPKTSLFFLLENGRRVHLKRVNGEFLGPEGRKYTAAEVAATAEAVSPNALLRPVLQDYILPTHTYVGGPAEIAYFAQSQVLYERLLGGMPNLLHRSGFTLIDGSTAKRLERYSLHLPDFFHGEEALRRRWPRRWPRRAAGEIRLRAGTGHGGTRWIAVCR